MSVQLMPRFGEVQAHYDLSDDFFRLFLDATRTYSCAYFHRDNMTLEEAQIAKVDLALSKLRLRPGMTLLDIGCGWGATMKRAIEKYDINVVGLTLSNNQVAHVRKMFNEMDTPRSRRVLLQGWEQFDEPVDRIVSIGAFEHFGHERYRHFFGMAHRAMPADGVMLLQTIVRPTFKELKRRGLTLTRDLVHFGKFMLTEIFPGGWLPTVPTVEEHATGAGFAVTRIESLQPHYARTLDMWATALRANKD
jgi:cyclopropane-fatty-acyl-phospholipid synthase